MVRSVCALLGVAPEFTADLQGGRCCIQRCKYLIPQNPSYNPESLVRKAVLYLSLVSHCSPSEFIK